MSLKKTNKGKIITNIKNKKIQMPWEKNKILQGSREEILNKLKKAANPNCKKCYGLGRLGYTENKKTGSRTYVPCKCIDGKVI